jgi:hypothetical protein
MAIPLVMEAYFYLSGASVGSLQHLHIVDLADAEVHGHPDRSYLAVNNYQYTPLRESPNDSVPVRVVIGVDEIKSLVNFPHDPDGSLAARGMCITTSTTKCVMPSRRAA